jgi:precorrin-2 dehydrogenase / sirohydrochlorin ferrochelatase
VSGYPVLLEGTRIDALVVGGGTVAWRKTAALLECGARVRVVAPAMCDALRREAASLPRLVLIERAYRPEDIDGSMLVIAATNDREVNARVAADADHCHRLVNVVDAPADGHYVTVAAYRADPLVIGVSTGGIPRAASRIRDAISARFDSRYRSAIASLGVLRQRLLAGGDGAGWRAAQSTLVDEGFCDGVEDGTFGARLAAWQVSAGVDPVDVAWP